MKAPKQKKHKHVSSTIYILNPCLVCHWVHALLQKRGLVVVGGIRHLKGHPPLGPRKGPSDTETAV